VSLGILGFGCASDGTNDSRGSVPCDPEDEVCDGEDNNCNGKVDEGCQCVTGQTQACYSGDPATKGVGACAEGQQTCDENGVWGACVGEVLPVALDEEGNEACDGVDNSCNGMTDEGCACSPPTADTKQDCYTGPQGTKDVGTCHGGQQSCTEEGTWADACDGQVIPADEACDNLDNDCNGVADDMGDLSCGVGACQVTVVKCVDGQLSECTANQPSVEVCDGVDNDCDQLIDENFPEKGKTCTTAKPGVCAPGKYSCAAGALDCVSDVPASPEKCDSLDNDCDGQVDENIGGTGSPCSTGLPGICSSGTISCKNNEIDCFQDLQPTAELCDGIDNDCDGQTDEGNPQGGAACNTGMPAACAAGTEKCVAGAIQCIPNVAGSAEVCDGVDNDCDGVVDENNPGGGVACATGQPGVCSNGIKNCTNGALVCTQQTQASTEVCDGVDNNCNGMTDENNPGGGAACSTGLLGVCAAGTMTCANGSVSCKQNVMASPENCTNGLDDDCDGAADPPVTVYFEETFANNAKGWTLGTDWQIGSATASSGHSSGYPDPAQDHTPTADNGVAGVVIGGNAPKVNHGMYYLTSPVIDLSAATSAYLEYWRFLNSDYSPYMVNEVSVYNGTSWVILWQTGGFPNITDSVWTKVNFDISAHKNAAFQIRFGYSIGNAASVYTISQWNLDDVKITNINCN
jgi:hypothetical protein